eukprot:jgi/Tetstr1/442837/TSEL_003214.t1
MSLPAKLKLKEAKYLEFQEVNDARLLVIWCISVKRHIRGVPGYRNIFSVNDTTVDDAHHNEAVSFMASLLLDNQAKGIGLKAADRANETAGGRAALKALQELRASYLPDERTLLAQLKASLNHGQSTHENLLDFMTRLEDLQIAIKDCGATVSDDDMLVSLLNGMRTEEATIRAVVKGDPTVTTFELAKAKIRTVQDHSISMEQPGAAFAAFAPTGATSYAALQARVTELEAEKKKAEAATRKSEVDELKAMVAAMQSQHNAGGGGSALRFNSQNRRCYNCNAIGHLARNCPKPDKRKTAGEGRPRLAPGSEEPPAKEFGALSFHTALLANATPELPPMPTDAWSVMPTSRRTMIRAAPPPPLSSHNPFGSLTFSDDTAGPDDEPTLLEEREMRDAIAVVSVEEQAIAAAVAAVAEEEAAERAAIADVAAFIAADPAAMTVARTSKATILPNDVAMRRAIITNDPTPWPADWLHSAAHRLGKAPVPMPTVTHVVPASRFNASTSSGMSSDCSRLSDHDLGYDSADDDEAMLVDFQRHWAPAALAARGFAPADDLTLSPVSDDTGCENNSVPGLISDNSISDNDFSQHASTASLCGIPTTQSHTTDSVFPDSDNMPHLAPDSIDDDKAVSIGRRSSSLGARSNPSTRALKLHRRAIHATARTFTAWPNASLPGTSPTAPAVMRNIYLDDAVDSFRLVPRDAVSIQNPSTQHVAAPEGVSSSNARLSMTKSARRHRNRRSARRLRKRDPFAIGGTKHFAATTPVVIPSPPPNAIDQLETALAAAEQHCFLGEAAPLPSIRHVRADPAALMPHHPLHVVILCAGATFGVIDGLCAAGHCIATITLVENDAAVRAAGILELNRVRAKWTALISYDAIANAYDRLPTHDVQLLTTDMFAALPRVDLLVATPPCQPFSSAGRNQGLHDQRAKPFYAVCRLVKQLNRAQSGITYVIENVAGAGRFPAICAALGDPVLARADELGSSSRRDTLLWTNARDPDALQAHYHRSLRRPTTVGDLIAKGGFAPEWQAPAHLRHSKFGKFVSRKGSFAHRMHGSTPGSSMLLHNGVYEEAPTDIKCISMGFDANAVDFPEVSADMRRRIIGACVDSNVARWLMAAISSASKDESALPSIHTFPHKWIFDSGATSHMVAQYEDYSDYQTIPRRWISGLGAYAVAPYSQFQNGLMERTWRTLSQWARCMDYASLQDTYWEFAMSVAAYIYNRTFRRGVHGIPLHLVTGAIPDLRHLRVFGCDAYAHVPRSTRHKAAPSARQAVVQEDFIRNIDPCEWVLLAGEAPGDPLTYTEAMNSSLAAWWLEAMHQEYNSLDSRRTWELVVLPGGRKAVKSKWLYKTKHNSDGTTARYKARVVAKGFSQVEGIDYTDTFAPTVKFTTLRVIFSIAAHHRLHIEQTDVDCAFLYADLSEEIYMEQPRGFEQYGPNGEKLVCRLRKAVYGLKQAPHNWQKLLNDYMTSQHCRQLRTDPGAYVFRSSDGGILGIIAIYVDDIIIVSNSRPWIAHFKQALGQRFDIKELGTCSWLLGMKVEHDLTAGVIKIHQSKYIHDMLERF